MARVVDVHVEKLRTRGVPTLKAWLAASPNHVYVGRNMTAYIDGAAESKWKNPYPVKKHGLQESLQLYTKRVVEGELFSQLDELDGRVLGCWCVDDDRPVETPECQCHAQVLCKLLEAKKRGWAPARS